MLRNGEHFFLNIMWGFCNFIFLKNFIILTWFKQNDKLLIIVIFIIDSLKQRKRCLNSNLAHNLTHCFKLSCLYKWNFCGFQMKFTSPWTLSLDHSLLKTFSETRLQESLVGGVCLLLTLESCALAEALN